MAEPTDVDADRCNLIIEESLGLHSAMMAESRGNAITGHAVVRLSAARKFNQEDPLEAAASEKILNG